MSETDSLLSPALAERLRVCRITPPGTLALGGRQGLHRSRQHGAAVEFADYRSYTPGDPTKLIDWRVYARSDRYLVRRYEEEVQLTAHILVDVSESMQFAHGDAPLKGRFACRLAAACALVLARQGDRVSLRTFAETLDDGLPPTGGMLGMPEVLRRLDRDRFAGGTRIAENLHAFADGGAEPGLVILVSDLLEPVAGLRSAFNHLRHAGHALRCYQVLDRSEITLPWEGVVEIDALEAGGRLVVELDALRGDCVARVHAHIDGIRRTCHELGWTHRLATTDSEIDRLLHAEAA